MKRIYLVQHGKSFSKDVDPERRLTEEGIKETRYMAEELVKKNVSIDKIIHSGKKRAEMTARIFADIMGVGDVSMAEGLSPLDDPKPWIGRIDEMEGDVMIVGHLPFLSIFTSLLLGVDTEVIEFRYSGVLCLEKGEDDKWRIKWYIRPD
jgi:phosphohistidine phosphatase